VVAAVERKERNSSRKQEKGLENEDEDGAVDIEEGYFVLW